MAENRRFSAELIVALQTTYKNVEVLLNPTALLDNLNVDFSQGLTNGSGLEKADLQWYDRRQLINSSEVLNLDNILTNNWGDVLDFDAIKILIIHNRESDLIEPPGPGYAGNDKNLLVLFKSERYNIGPGGVRTVIEPSTRGIPAIVASGSEEEGAITISSSANVTYDIIIIGSQDESSSG